jgi:phage terminase large subunit-like protein
MTTSARRDPVTTYARRVSDGRILAGRLVRLACERHLRDLTRQGTEAFRFQFKASRAERCFQFFREFLTLDDGRPFELMSWLKFVFGSIEGWISDDGRQRFQTAYIETGKGTAKTPSAAGYGVFALVGKGERSAEIYSLGVDGKQASYLFQFAKRMAGRSEDLRRALEIGEHNIAYVARDSFLRPLSAEGRSLDNKRPYLALVDELHEHPSAVIPEKMRLGFKGREDALLFEITNAGFDQTSVCWAHHDYSAKVLEQVIQGPASERWFAYVCQLDACDTCRDQGATQPADGCQNCDDWTDPSCWLKANPSLGQTMTVPQLQALVDEAIDRPGSQARVKRLNFCMWTQAHTVWIPSDRWNACTAERLATSADGRACAVGFDMSEKLDLTACALALRVDDSQDATEDVIELTDVDHGQEMRKTLNINFCVELSVYFWLPRETLIERVKHESIPFDLWEKSGWLRVTPGAVIDYDLIYEQFRTEIAPPFKPGRVGYDKHNASQFALQLRDKARFEVVDIPQGRALSESFKLFEALVRLRRIRHNGNPVLAWCVSNADPKRDRYENLWLEKPSPTKRIDGVIASVIALNQLVLLPKRRTRPRKPMIWTPGGFVPADGSTPEPWP